MAIKSFADKETETFFTTGKSRRFSDLRIAKVAARKLDMVNAAVTLADLRTPPSNKLHPLYDDREGQHAIWINDQWRVCFRWTSEGPAEVEITDYH